jgi:preprotein translocase subunit SecY
MFYMDASKERAPSAQETLLQMAQSAGLRSRILFTLGLLILAHFGNFVPIPGVDRVVLTNDIKNSPVIGSLDIFSGSAYSTVGVFAVGIIPYINASIIIQLLTTVLPYLKKLQKEEGEAGRRKISQITRYVAVGWGIANSIGISLWLQKYALPGHEGIFFTVSTVMALTAGSMFVMWISELITERGIGNGASLLIFLNIVAVLPKSLADTFNLAQSGDSSILTRTVALLAVFMVMTMGIIFVEEGTRRIPIISARHQVGRSIQGESNSYISFSLNQGKEMPIIFASSVLRLPPALASFASNSNSPAADILNNMASILAPDTAVYVVLYVLLINYFNSLQVRKPVDIAQNLKKMGASIPGIWPGVATSKYIGGIITSLTLLGAIFISIIATMLIKIENALQVTTFKGFSAIALFLLVSIAIHTSKQVQTLVISQRYET